MCDDSVRRLSTSFSIADIISPHQPHLPVSADHHAPVVVRPWEMQTTLVSGRDGTTYLQRLTAAAAALTLYHWQAVSSMSPLCALYNMTTNNFVDSQNSDRLQVSQLREISLAGRHKLQPQSTSATEASMVVKKRRKSRTAFTSYQLQQLERCFSTQKYLLPADRDVTARRLGLTSAQVITWFQNRRAKLKRDLEELRADVDAAKSLTSSTAISSGSSSSSDNKRPQSTT